MGGGGFFLLISRRFWFLYIFGVLLVCCFLYHVQFVHSDLDLYMVVWGVGVMVVVCMVLKPWDEQ